MKIRPVGAELFQSDGQKDCHDEAISRPSQFCEYAYKRVPFTSVFSDAFTAQGYVQLTFFFPVALRPYLGHGLLIHEVSRSHTTTHHSR